MNFRFLVRAGLISAFAVQALVPVSLVGADDLKPPVSAPRDDKRDAAWPEFRGPGGQGHSPAIGLPVTWSETENIAWKASLPGRGWSSPVISGEQIWLTAADEDGKTLRALRLDRATGAIDRDVVVANLPNKGPAHDKNTLASPTPLLEGDRVYVHFGPYATACLSDEGKILWQTALPHQQAYGPSSSPVLFDDVLIVPCLGTDTRYMIALDKRTGAPRWKQAFEGRNAESTPLVIKTDTGAELVSHQADRIVSLDPTTGQELWWVAQENFAQIPRPVAGLGLVFIAGGYFKPEVWAIRPGGRGDVADTHVVWHNGQAAPHSASPLLVDDLLYYVSDNGVASCVDARSGKQQWRERLGGDFSASPIFADGRIYFLNEIGATSVIAPGAKFERLATNNLPGRTLASLAVAGRAIYLRTDTHLYRIEKSG
ncbi:MAG TPA: PQQ-binding-like beta-propeller repeat protein [Pirellulales bacterium]|nr:PQQ-binding-like beta-propeller repeat protein [Pirellulales bacterium]